MVETNHFQVKPEQKKIDQAEDMKKACGGDPNLSLVEKITLGGNSYGFEACQWFADQISAHNTPKLVAVDFGNIFVSRLRAEIPKSLNVMAQALLPKQLIEVDLSDNAFGPDGVQAFQCLLEQDKNLRILRVTNCGLGPEGACMIADALMQNQGLKLTHFYAGRDRLECKGITALAAVFKHMGSLKEIHVPQNGIKDPGMMELLESLSTNKDLQLLRINDNWIKRGATQKLLGLVLNCVNLTELDISDGNMGTENVLVTLRAIQRSKNGVLQQFSCNYNDVESRKCVNECLELLYTMTNITQIDFIGNLQSKKLCKQWTEKFQGRKIRLIEDVEDEDLEDDEDEDEAEAEDDFDQEAIDELTEMMQQLQIN